MPAKRKLSLSLLLFTLQNLHYIPHLLADSAPRKLPIADHERIMFTHMAQQLELKCPVEIYDAQTQTHTFIEWTRGDESLYMVRGYEIKKNGILKIKSVTKEHAGTYTCEGINGYGLVKVNITVIVDNPEVENENNTPINPNSVNRVNVFPPSIKKRPATSFIDEVGGQATFHCVASGQPTPHIFWFKNGHLVQDSEMEVSKGKVHSTLKLRGLRNTDAGIYKCIARNKMGEDQMDFILQVTETPKPPRIVSLEPPNAIIKEGEAVVFWCEVNSKPGLKLHIKWLKRLNKEEIGDSIHLDDTTLFRSGTAFYRPLNLSDGTSTNTGVYKSKLLIRNSCKEDSGTYVCLALNDKGFNFKNVTLTVISTVTKSFSTPSYFSPSDTSFVVTVIIALVVVLAAAVLVSHLCCRGKSIKGAPSRRPAIDAECGNLKQSLTVIKKQGKKDISYPELNDLQSKSKLLYPVCTLGYETENQTSKSVHVKTYVH